MNILPWPQSVELTPGAFTITAETTIICDAKNEANGHYLQELFAAPLGFSLPIHLAEDPAENTIYLSLDREEQALGAQGYLLVITPDRIGITALTTTGVFYGLQTLRHCLPLSAEGDTIRPAHFWKIPCAIIEDKPRFSWRGFMLDEGRHFQGKQTVLRLLDAMALLKLNRFHWHLTDDQGWRLEINKYPRLTEVGACRPGTAVGQISRFRRVHDGIPHGGYYTQDDVSEIVAYAAERHITIMPEIEMPGHATAALAAYPEFGCTGEPVAVATGFGIFKNVFCLGKERTTTFLLNVLEEVLAIFPGQYIHIGGDEAPRSRWKKCPDCQRRLVDEGFQDEGALQLDLTNRLARFLADNKRTLVGWNEILDDGLHPSAAIHYWMGDRKRVIQEIKNGRQAIISSYQHYYLDHTYRFVPLSKTYNHEPRFPELSPDEAKYILGIEAPLWTEHVPSRERLGYQAFPRLLAVAETAWTPAESKDLANFKYRMLAFQDCLESMNINYAPIQETEPSRLSRLFSPLSIIRL